MDVQLAIYKFICSPQFSGWENIPENTKKLMFVGNHAILVFEKQKKLKKINASLK